MSRTYEEKIVIGSKVDSRGFKKADRELKKLSSTVKNLASGFGIAFSARSIGIYARNAVEAFAADDKAARTLSKTLSNLGLQFADPKVKEFIASLEQQYGVLDDFLRPAYQKLLTSTGDWAKSQELLKTALDLSAQSGVDLVTVAEDLGKAYVGNNKGLQKYSLGISKAKLASMSFEDILKEITKISGGQATEAANTYSGKLDKLKVSAANASEVIGGALLDSIIRLSGGDIDKATSKVEKLSTSFADLLRLLTGGKTAAGNSFKDLFAQVDFKYGLIPTTRQRYAPTRGGAAGAMAAQAAEKKARDEAARRAKLEATNQAKLTKATQDNLKLAKAKAIFDLQKIQIEAALKGKISEEDRIRLKLMQAIEDENITQIEKYTKLLDDAQKKTKELTDLLTSIKGKDAGDPFANWKSSAGNTLDAINKMVAAMFAVQTQIQANSREWSSFANQVANTTIQANMREWSSTFSPSAMNPVTQTTNPNVVNNNVTVNTGVGDPNSIAEAIDQVLTEAVSRGTLRGLMIA